MQKKVIFISTVHQETGNCNSERLAKIIEEISPQVIFLEALDDTYTDYQKLSFTDFGVYHKKLEIAAIQKYSHVSQSFKYVPVLNHGLFNSFEKKYNIICENFEFQNFYESYILLKQKYGFEFLNSDSSIKIQNEMRELENRILRDKEIEEIFNSEINLYEESMIKNIYSYCDKHEFVSAIFMCGVAHRESIIEKLKGLQSEGDLRIKWEFYRN